MKKTILLALGFLFSTFVFSQNAPSLITTTGEAVVYAAPDEILLDFTITTTDDNLAEARSKNRDVTAPVIEYLKNAGIEAKHIQTQYMSLEPVKENYKSNKVLFYRASQTIAICITDLEKYEPIVDKLLEMQVTSVGSPRFRTTKFRERKDEARQKAILAAREKAEMLAATLDQKIGKAFTINELGMNWAGTRQGAYANIALDSGGGGNNDGAAFAPGQLEIRALVEVAFYLE